MNEQLAKEAKDLCIKKFVPVDTGELRDSLYTEVTKEGFVLGANARHAVFNEYGSLYTPIGGINNPAKAKKKGFRPFIRPTLYEMRKKHRKIFHGKWYQIVGHG
jgi:hypothetical protein